MTLGSTPAIVADSGDIADSPRPLTSHRGISASSEAGTVNLPVNDDRQLEINGKEYTLSFNARIRDEGNRIIPVWMVQQEKRVRYTLNNQGQVDKIWLLAPDEK